MELIWLLFLLRRLFVCGILGLFGCFSIQSTVLVTSGCCCVDNSSSQVS